MSIYVQSNEYSELCKYCNLSAQQSIAAIKYCLFRHILWQGDWQLVALRLFVYSHLFEF